MFSFILLNRQQYAIYLPIFAWCWL